jgi:hypothetical protein
MPIGSSSGEYYADAGDLLVDQYKMPEPKPVDESRPKVYITPPSTSSTMPLGGPTEAAGEFKSESGTQVPDYDYNKWKEANPGVEMAPGQHYPDTYKLPNHMTFSDESMYHGQNGEQGGHWDKGEGDTWSFTPGPSNLKYHTMDELKDYFKRVEPGNTLNPPNIEDVPHHDWIEDTLKGIYHAIQAPGEAFQGKLDPMSEEGARRVSELGMTMVGGPSGMVGKEATLGSGAVKGGKLPDIWKVDPKTLSPGTLVTAGEGGATGKYMGTTKAGTVVVDWKNFQAPPKGWEKAAWFKSDTPEPPKDVAKYQKYIDMFKDAGHNVKKAVQNAVDAHNSQFATMREKFMTDLQKSMEVPKEKGYTEPAFRGLSVYKGEGAASSIHDFNAAGLLYSSNSPMLADMYAGYLSEHPGYKVPEHAFGSGSQVMPLVIDTKDYHYYDAAGGHWTEHNSKAIQEAKKKNMKGVVVDRVSDEPNSTTTLGPKTVYITFPKGASTVKSRFAKDFDPTSPDMLKGIGAIGIGTAATGYVATDENLSQ